ncbi:hypothetical protein [Sphingobium sp. TKS]|uniref:hypothetical protein n=1 Tax=Sphingobium sp. TKS TaxID=1315974 RepID=UPI0007700FB8|nr:hypothetical protein [Sphingobium sp. TKS]AMK24380.1 hypothetical protein K426_17240 [Sphingobium sp. TKS]
MQKNAMINHKAHLFRKGEMYLDRYLATRQTCDEALLGRTRMSLEIGAIAACIQHGLVSRRDLLQTAGKVCGSTSRMVGQTLDEYVGTDPSRHLWFTREVAPNILHYRLHY